MFEVTDDPQTLYYVTMREDDNAQDVYVSGTQWEFTNWIEENVALYSVVVQNWAIVAFEQEMNSRRDVISYAASERAR